MNNQPVMTLKGVGDAVGKRLADLGITTVGELLEHFPRRYEDRSLQRYINQIRSGEFSTFSAVVEKSELKHLRGKSIAKLWVRDSTGSAELVWFNQPYRTKAWKPGAKILVYGKASRFGEIIQFDNPEVEIESDSVSLHIARIVPVYPLTQGIASRTLRKLIAAALQSAQTAAETIPLEIRQKYRLISRESALREIHFPTDWQTMKQAKRRIVFEELFFLQCALAYLRNQRFNDRRSVCFATDGDRVRSLLELMPFKLTDDQQAAYNEIKQDMETDKPMQRLLQGDVGSGKTAVALLALVKTVENGLQGIMMVPTEILAEQHYQSCFDLLSRVGVSSALLTGRVKGKARHELLQRIKLGELGVVFGTHALLQPDVLFRKVGLVVVDEQHRFGVNQRASLQGKGEVPHALVMSATPIPRTMALTLYGDLDISTIRQLPPGRKPVVTVVRSGEQAREKVYRYLSTEVAAGRQGYVVCPLIEDSEKTEAQSALSVFRELSESMLKAVSCGLLHGRMTAPEKETVMRKFVSGELGVLISTTVIEVGINVPNATMMIIEDADRFGLAQLHQLRGRVGRGAERSFCVLLHADPAGEIPERLKVLAETPNGFVVAEKDLLLRGPGQFLGYRQHGLPEMKMASLADDADLLIEARDAGIGLMQEPEGLKFILPYLKERFERFFGVLFAG
jgi:ATP-dependent DNA helicase RecG